MFGKNPVAKPDVEGTGEFLHVVAGSPFYTIQGEGPHAGRPAVFLRLHGCPLRCFFCDTEFSAPTDPTVDVRQLVQAIRHTGPEHCRLLVITGGEPVRQNLAVLVRDMVGLGWLIQVETSGILWQSCLLHTDVVVSPKTPKIDQHINDHAIAFKYVIQAGQVSDEDGLPVTNTQVDGGKPAPLARYTRHLGNRSIHRPDIYLSPMDEYDLAKNVANRLEVGRLAMKFGYRAGLQLHKHLELP